MFKDHPASHIDASWSMCLAHAIDQINSASGGAETPEIKEFYRGLCRMLLATWDGLERVCPHQKFPASRLLDSKCF